MSNGDWQEEARAPKFTRDELDALRQLTPDANAGKVLSTLLPESREFLGAWQGMFGINLQEMMKRAGEEIKVGVGNAMSGILDWLTAGASRAVARSLEDLEKKGYVNRELRETITGLVDKAGVLAWPLAIGIMSTVMLSTALPYIKAISTITERGVNASLRPNPPGAGDILRAGFIDPNEMPTIRAWLAQLGLPEDAIRLIFKAQYATYSADQAIRLYLKGDIAEAKLFERMREQGFTDDRTQELLKLAYGVPPISDILYMLAREAFEEDQVRKMGLDDEYPTAAIPFAKANGLSEEWLKRYWRAHWEQPSLGQMYEMLHRRLITEDELYQFMRVVEIPPYWRDKLMAISYNTYTRVDTRRMYGTGVLDAQGVYDAYRDEGYNHEKALKMTEFTIRYESEAEKDLTRSQIEQAYKLGMISSSDASELFKGMGYSGREAEFMISAVDYKAELDLVDERVKVVEDRYTANLIDDTTARDRLGQLGLQGDSIEHFLEKWEVKRFKARKKLTKTDLDKMVLAGVVSPDEYIEEMLILGYSEKYVNWYLQLLASGA